MRKAFSIGSAWMLAAMLVIGGYAWAADMGTSSGTASDASKSKDSAKSKSTKSTSSDMGSSDMKGKSSGGGSERVKQVQTALKDKGQDPGPIDGVMGPKTKAAIKAYQGANNLKATGRLDSETAKSLGVESASSSGSSSSASKSSKSGSSDMGADKSGASGAGSKSSKSSSSSDTGGSSGSFGGDRPSGRNAPSSRDTTK